MKAMTRISSITRRDIQMMTSPNEDDAKRSKSLSDMPTDMTVDIDSLRNVNFIWRNVYFRSGKYPLAFLVRHGPLMAIDLKIKDYQNINKIRTPILENKKREPEVISSRSAVFQAPRLSILQNLNKLNNNNNSNTNNNTGFSLRVPQITLNGSKTVRFTTFCSFLIIYLRKAVQEYLAMIRLFVKIFPKTGKLVRTGPSLQIPVQIRTQTVLT